MYNFVHMKSKWNLKLFPDIGSALSGRFFSNKTLHCWKNGFVNFFLSPKLNH